MIIIPPDITAKISKSSSDVFLLIGQLIPWQRKDKGRWLSHSSFTPSHLSTGVFLEEN